MTNGRHIRIRTHRSDADAIIYLVAEPESDKAIAILKRAIPPLHHFANPVPGVATSAAAFIAPSRRKSPFYDLKRFEMSANPNDAVKSSLH
jgi:hypothetical protein